MLLLSLAKMDITSNNVDERNKPMTDASKDFAYIKNRIHIVRAF